MKKKEWNLIYDSISYYAEYLSFRETEEDDDEKEIDEKIDQLYELLSKVGKLCK